MKLTPPLLHFHLSEIYKYDFLQDFFSQFFIMIQKYDPNKTTKNEKMFAPSKMNE